MTEYEFRLNAAIQLSGEISQEILEELKEPVKERISRGVPEGRGVSELEMRAENRRIELRIVSDRYLRAHDALLRIRKILAEELGKRRIGLRGIEIREYEIETNEPLDVKVRVPFVKEMRSSANGTLIILNVSEADVEKRIPDRILNLIEEKKRAKEYGSKAEHWELVFESRKKEFKYFGDPTEEMIKRNWIKHGSCRGQWIYGPQITKLFRTFEKIVVRELLEPLGYHEMIFPKLVSWEVWKRSGHAKAIYPEIYYVCTPKTRDPEFWEDVMDYFKVTHEVPVELIKEKIDPPIGGMTYAQCPPFWVFLQGRTLPDDILPIKIFDRSGTSHRYESGGIHGIERVDEFHRIEIVWMGTPEQVVEEAEKLREGYRRIFEEYLDLQWREARVTPWFMAQEGLTDIHENAKVGTVDFEGYLPYKNEWLEFQNVSVYGDKYPRGFSVKLQSRKELWSGCSGIGLERWAAVFLAQKGFNTDDWPEKLVKEIGELPEVFRFL
ncbi:MAG: seryl-tRNA synthetase [Archaeoglobi archaeon]|nr:seryl-tRNA synthetase [Archaeoglobi archaeon]